MIITVKTILAAVFMLLLVFAAVLIGLHIVAFYLIEGNKDE